MVDPKMRWSLVIPMWEEAGRIGSCIERLAQSPLNADDIEIILVDDGSADGTAVLAKAAIDRTSLNAKVLRHERNEGKGWAVRTGVLAAGGEVVGFVDADLSTSPEDIVCVFTASEAGADVAIASRTHAKSVISDQQPLPRRVGGLGFNLVLRLLGITRFTDTQCGLKAFRGTAVRPLFEPMRTHRFAFDAELLARARHLGLVVEEVPVTWRHVEYSRVAPLRDGWRMLRDAVRIRRAVR